MFGDARDPDKLKRHSGTYGSVARLMLAAIKEPLAAMRNVIRMPAD
jgi:hypothetical protein